VISDAVFEHIPDVGASFREIGRVLKPGGVLIGYVAFMECFHEISYSHLSFKALEHFARINGMQLEHVAGATRFGIDYHLAVHLYPIPFGWGRAAIASAIRGLVWVKSRAAGAFVRWRRKLGRAEARRLADDYYALECLRQSNGFTFIVRRSEP
jgi:SAM-dependent methyltransferase